MVRCREILYTTGVLPGRLNGVWPERQKEVDQINKKINKKSANPSKKGIAFIFVPKFHFQSNIFPFQILIKQSAHFDRFGQPMAVIINIGSEV